MSQVDKTGKANPGKSCKTNTQQVFQSLFHLDVDSNSVAWPAELHLMAFFVLTLMMM